MTSSAQISRKRGFTLVELLIVIGIIGLLSTVMIVSFGKIRKVAMRNEAQKLVDQAKVSFEAVLLAKQSWPIALINNMQHGMNRDVCWYLQSNHFMDLTTKEKSRQTGAWDWSESSLDRFGLLDPWGRNALKINTGAQNDTDELGNGNTSTFKDHVLQYRLDMNGDGFVDASDCRGCTMPVDGMRIRASVIVWSRGANGIDDGESDTRYPIDDSLSFSLADTKAQ